MRKGLYYPQEIQTKPIDKVNEMTYDVNRYMRIFLTLALTLSGLGLYTNYVPAQTTNNLAEDTGAVVKETASAYQFCTLDVVQCGNDEPGSDSARSMDKDEPVRAVADVAQQNFDRRNGEHIQTGSSNTEYAVQHVHRKTDSELDATNIQQVIKDYSEAYGVNVDTALRIASCESRFDPLAKNKYSTASGVYQFLKGTWEGYCEGDVFDAEANIKCFMQLYPKHPGWWECK